MGKPHNSSRKTKTAKSVGVNHAAKSNTHSQQGCAHTPEATADTYGRHVKRRWELAAGRGVMKAERGEVRGL